MFFISALEGHEGMASDIQCFELSSPPDRDDHAKAPRDNSPPSGARPGRRLGSTPVAIRSSMTRMRSRSQWRPRGSRWHRRRIPACIPARWSSRQLPFLRIGMNRSKPVRHRPPRMKPRASMRRQHRHVGLEGLARAMTACSKPFASRAGW